MKDIKELIFAAVEENAVQFQELANELLHARAYEAIEALRPEVGASMFGEAKECDDEDMEDDEEDEDEDEKKSKVDEELKGNQHKIDKNKNGKIDAHDFKLLRKEEVEELDELNKKTLASYVGKSAVSLRKPNIDIARGIDVKKNIDKVNKREDGIALAAKKLAKEEVEELDELSKGTLGSYIKKASGEAVQRAHAQVNAERGAEANPKVGVWKDMAKLHQDKKWKRMTGVRKATDKLTQEEVEELDELSQGLLRKASASAYRKSSTHSGIAAQERQRVRGAADHVDHEKRAATRLGQANKFRAAADAKNEEVEQIDELSKDTLGSYIKKASGAVTAKGKHATDPVNTPKLDQMASRSYGWHGKKWEPKDKLKTRKQGIVRAVDKLTKEEVEQVDEVAMPQNQADWQALITHQVKTTGHPVATDAQFRATHGKDTSKIASLEPGEDKAQYASAQGGNVKQ